MEPNLLVGDRIFVTKYTYGYSKHSFPFSPSIFKGRLLYSKPSRGDVIVFKTPVDNRTDYIKRLIGIPGDRVQVLDGILVVNGKKAIRSKTNIGKMHNKIGNIQIFNEYIEKFEDSQAHRIIESSDNDYFDNTIEFKVPDGHYFFMGDNRDNSNDSRYWGFVPRENFMGTADYIWMSWECWTCAPSFKRVGKIN